MGSGVNLIPYGVRQARRERKHARRGLRVTAVYLTLLLGGTVAYTSLTSRSQADARAAADRLATVSERAAMLDQQALRTGVQLVETTRRVEGSRVLSERPDWSTLLRLVAQLAGPEVILGGLSVQTTGHRITAGASVEVRGIATDPAQASAFVLRLEDSGLFDAVTLASSGREPYAQLTATSFVLRCALHPVEEEAAP